ncbi:MAG: nucleotidyl transferase AbiEii/AbiGii toxin family protein [Betaproteobacteria bacterium]
MTATSLDFSQKLDLLPLARVVGALQAVAAPAGVQFFLIGAAARNLMLRHAHNIEPERLTEDVDFAVMVRDWNTFATLRSAMIASGEFAARPGPATQRLRHTSGRPLDIVPFGGVERVDRTIAWPPDQATVFDCFGAREAFGTCVQVLLPEGTRLRVPSIPALALLKVVAWRDRKHTFPGRDAPDLVLYLRSYLDCGNLERATTEYADLFTGEDFDYEGASARLLAREMIALLDGPSARRVLDILASEADEERPLLLAHQSGIDLERARRLLGAVCDELAGAMEPPGP